MKKVLNRRLRLSHWIALANAVCFAAFMVSRGLQLSSQDAFNNRFAVTSYMLLVSFYITWLACAILLIKERPQRTLVSTATWTWFALASFFVAFTALSWSAFA